MHFTRGYRRLSLRQRKGVDRERAEELLLLSVRLAVEARDEFWAEYQGSLAAAAAAAAAAAVDAAVDADAAAAGTPTTSEATAPRHVSPPTPPPPPTTTTTTTTPTPTGAGVDGTQLGESVPPGERRRRRRRRPLVAASLGCYGAALADGSEYGGAYGDTVGQRGLQEWHKERLDVLAGADGVDLLAFETIPCLAEVRAILCLLRVMMTYGVIGFVLGVSERRRLFLCLCSSRYETMATSMYV